LGWAVPFAEQSIETWRKALEVNLTTPFHLVQGLFGLLQKSDSPAVVNLGSIYGTHGPDWDMYAGTSMGNPAAYSASKGGLIQLTRWLATTLGPRVRVNCVSPGGISRNQDEKFVKKYAARTPLARMAVEDDIVSAILFLSSLSSNYITGQNVEVDGGWSTW
jgi:NAD(P)-dependent dehydrogenase (short-subunit alcohol dehydrogenase family)